MKKTKLITVLLLLAVLATVFLATLVACEPKPDGGISGNHTPSGDPNETPSGSNDDIWKPPTPSGNPGGNTPEIPKYTSKEMLNKIIESVEVPEQVLNLDVYVKFENEDQVTTINLKGNFYSEVRNELCLAVYQQQKGEADSQRQLVFAVYIVNDKIYIDRADGTPLIYLSDFDFNYIIQIIEGAGGMVSDLTGSLEQYMGLIDLVFNVLFGVPEVKVGEDGSQSLAMELRLKSLLSNVTTFLPFLPFDIPIDIKPLVNYLADLI